MRKGLLFSAAAAPLLLSAAAHAQTVIEDTNQPVRTSTANNGQPDDVEVTGTVEVDSGTGVTLDSDNDLEISGAVLIEDADGAVGVLLQGGNTGTFTLTGDIEVSENYEPDNPDDDFDLDGPFAQGSNRTGILVEGPEAFEGDIVVTGGANIRVEGNESYGVRVASGVDGDINLVSNLSIIGTDSTAVAFEGPVSGDVLVGGTVRGVGENTQGMNVSGDIGGALTVSGVISTTGFRTVNAFGDALNQLDEDDLLNGGSALTVSAGIADGIRVANAGAGVISQSSSPAFLITTEGASGDVVIGGFPGVDGDDDDDEIDESDANGFGLINFGDITGDGVYEGYDAIALQLSGGETLMVDIEKGLYNANRIFASASEGDAHAIIMDGNVSLPLIFNDNGGLIRATSTTENGGRAQAITIGAGGNVNTINNDSAILAEVIGEDGTAIAIMDESGSLTEINNTSSIVARFTSSADDSNDEEIPPGEFETVAIDLSNATDGVTINQELQVAPPDSGDNDDDGDTEEPDPDFVAPTPAIVGDVRLGSGDDLVNIQAGTLDGDIDFGDGADQLTVDGGASVLGSLSDTDGDLVIQVNDGLLQLENPSVVTVRDATFGEEGTLRLLLDGESVARLEAQGVVRFEDGAAIAASLASLVGDGGSFEIVSASDLQIEGSLEQLSQTETPYLYNSSLQVSENNPNSLVLTLNRKTAQELGLNANEAKAYDAAFDALSAGGGINGAFAGITTEEGFFDAYEQLLPDFSSATLQFVMNNVNGATGAVGNRLDVARLSREARTTGVWAQEFGTFSDRESTNIGGGYRGHGFGFAAGVDRPFGPFYAAGANMVISTNEIEQINGVDEPLDVQTLGFGLYAGGARGGLTYDVYMGGGVSRFESERRILIGAFDQTARADWTGYHYSGSARLGYDWDLGWAMLRPLVSLDYLSLSEEGYTESGLSDVNLTVEERDSDMASATASLALARRFGTDDSWWAPQLRVGVRNEFGGSLAVTQASFVDFNDPFLLAAPELPSTSAIIGFLITGGSQYSSFGFNYDADIRDGFIRHSARIVVRLAF
ncbi:autotransporter outer membrane beta-barrel domain-containing protein [Euryhalocaulis caribicus]|uniref:autotransporter outer membrane beta-barrel domain-containing protein n=1 Tax=Euryhalocaulis caribicus TaxID=1161401 RepID=UPI0003A086CC|nr:autotransporter outer membrane beta-barrel domain-containing protein [Euryhalocaulis caribicus]